MTNTTSVAGARAGLTGFEPHRGRGPFNAAFFHRMDPVLRLSLGERKQRLFSHLPERVVEIGSGAGANLRYLAPGSTLVAIEPNRYMHPPLRAAAQRRGVHLELRETMAERTGLPNQSVDCVISSLVLCSVQDPAEVLAEIRQILRPGGTFRFVEHVVAREGSITRRAQRLFRRPWAWTFEGCSCERDLESLIQVAGFSRVEVEHYQIHTPFIPFNSHIAGIAYA